ncbi:MAG: hypothetical protein H7Y06_05420, partial [Opitutaceae bacterium]|nr:hypothetical protein [Opitutaceae bacterium]
MSLNTNSWTTLWYIIQYQLFGMSPVAFHSLNWLLHTAVGCVLFGFGRDFLKGKWPEGVALFGALLFVVHPLASEIPNYARTQDLAWVTLFSLLAGWLLLAFLRDGGWWKLAGGAVFVAGATFSKGPGMFHALMVCVAVGLVHVSPEHWKPARAKAKWIIGACGVFIAILWISGILPGLIGATGEWSEPRFIGHAYTLSRVFWEFAWRSVIPV